MLDEIYSKVYEESKNIIIYGYSIKKWNTKLEHFFGIPCINISTALTITEVLK